MPFDFYLIKLIFIDGTHLMVGADWCTSGCAVEFRICNREVVGSNIGRGYFAPRSTQPSIPPGSVNEYEL